MDERGHKTSPAACFEPAESERAATEGSPCGTGREVDEAGHETGPAACFEPAESERHAGREVEAEWAHYKTLG